MAVKNNDLNIILKGKNKDDQGIVLQGIAALYNTANLVLMGVVDITSDQDITLQGKTIDDQGVVLASKFQDEQFIILNAIDAPDISAAFPFKEAELDDFKITSGELINEITVKYGYDYAEKKFKNSITKQNPLSKLLYRESKKTLDLKMIQHTRQAEKICDAVLFTSSIPEIITSFKHNLRSLYVECGNIVSVTHKAGLGIGGYDKALGTVITKIIDSPAIDYDISMSPTGNLYSSELVNLSQVAVAGTPGITIEYESGVATITVYADIAGYPPVEGANITINGVVKVTDLKGQARFNLESGTYTAYLTASGYEDAEVTFTV